MSFFNQLGRTMNVSSWSAKRAPSAAPAPLDRAYGTPSAPLDASCAPATACHKPLYLCQPFVRSTLIKGSFRTIVALPKFVHPCEWIAINCTLCR